MVSDLGYKKVYLTNILRLSQAKVWEQQRILRPERAAAIAQDKLKHYDSTVGTSSIHMPGVITMFEDIKTGLSGIIDGQHRAAALVMLAQEDYWGLHDRNILVDVFATSNENQIMDLFVEINKGEPLRDIDMPSRDVNGIDSKRRLIVTGAVTLLAEKYAQMFKNNTKCRAPYLNIGKLSLPHLSSPLVLIS